MNNLVNSDDIKAFSEAFKNSPRGEAKALLKDLVEIAFKEKKSVDSNILLAFVNTVITTQYVNSISEYFLRCFNSIDEIEKYDFMVKTLDFLRLFGASIEAEGDKDNE